MKITFLLGTLFCGSTILGNLLNSLNNVKYLGEVNRFRKFKQFETSPDYYVDKSMLSVIRNIDCEFWNTDLAAKIDDQDLINSYLSIAKQAYNCHLIDGSKDPDWLNLLFQNGLADHFRVSAIIVVRNVFAFVCSYLDLHNCSPQVPARIWRDTYKHALRSLTHRGIPFSVIRYEDLMLNPKNIISKSASDFIDIEDINCIENYHLAKNDSLGGNSGAYINYGFGISPQIDPVIDRKILFWQNYKLNSLKERWKDCLVGPHIDQILLTEGVIDIAFDLGYNLPYIFRSSQLYSQ